MSLEFDLIKKYFHHPLPSNSEVILGPGDDAAIVQIPTGKQLVISTDTLVKDTHFDQHTPAHALGHKILAVNLSDFAAMGAKAKWLNIGLTLPTADESWISDFAKGLFQLCDQHQVALTGGDLTQGPLCMTATLCGVIDTNQSLRQTTAQTGDLIAVSGHLGLAQLAYRNPTQAPAAALRKLHYPCARTDLGQSLLTLAHSAIDISDGLIGDLNHILNHSQKGAKLWVEKLPIATEVTHDRINAALNSGDEYELCFTFLEKHQSAVMALATPQCPITIIGEITESKQLQLLNNDGSTFKSAGEGWEHF